MSTAPPGSENQKAPPGRRARRIAEARSRVANLALDLFAAHGFAATTVEDICAAAQISRSSFFRYYDGKESVLFAQLVESHRWVLEQLRSRPAGEAPLVSVMTVCRNGMWPQLDRRRLRTLRSILASEPALRYTQRLQLVNTFTDELAECLAQRSPERPTVEIRLTTDLAVSWMQWAIVAHMRDGRPLAEHFDVVFSATEQLARQFEMAMAKR